MSGLIGTTTFMQKSGQGTPMMSRNGKSTAYQYLCFSQGIKEEDDTIDDLPEDQLRRLQKLTMTEPVQQTV